MEKILIDGIAVSLGMEQSAVKAVIGEGQLIGKRYYYYDSEMAIDYDNSKRVEFIEFLGGIDGSLRPEIYGVSVFDAHADEVTNLLAHKNNGEVVDTEQGYSYAFPDISVGIYREMRPSDVAEMIEEMKADGIATENNEDLANDMRRAMHWATIGIGVAGYYR